MRKLLFSVTIHDCEVSTMTAGGPGGQHQNRSQTAIRIVHEPSGARGESREYKSQHANKKAAFKRMANSKEFQTWIRREAARREGEKSIEEKVEEMLKPENIRLEVNENKKWVVASELTEKPSNIPDSTK